MSKFTKGIFYSILLTAGSIPAVSADEVFHEAVNQSLPFWSVIPFVVMLLAVAFVPLINGFVVGEEHEVGIARVRALLPYTILVCVWYF